MSPKAFFIAFKAVCNERMKGKSVMPTVLPLGLCAFVMCLCTHKSGPVNSGHDPSHPSAWPLYMVSPLCCASFHIPINVTGTSRHRQQPIWGGLCSGPLHMLAEPAQAYPAPLFFGSVLGSACCLCVVMHVSDAPKRIAASKSI